MSSTESSGAAPAEAAATTPAPSAPVSFGTSRGSGLSRGKRPAPAGPANASAPASDYRPTAIEIVQAPREYQNPFAPAPAPEAAPPESPTPAAIVEAKPVAAPTPREMFPLEDSPTAEPAEKAELNILEPAEQKAVPAQTWESEGFRSRRDDTGDRASHVDAQAGEEVDIASIPPQFLYVRPGVKFVPTPRNWGSGEPRPRRGEGRTAGAKLPESAPAREHAAPESPGFFGWLKSLFGGAKPAAKNGGAHPPEHRSHRRHRGGHGDSAQSEHGGEHRERGGRRRRGGRDRSHRRSHGEPQGSRQGGSI